MNAIVKIQCAKKIFEEKLNDSFTIFTLDFDDPKIGVEMKNGIKLYIQYNDHDQYSYSLIFSTMDLDRCRYDNYDQNWDVKSKPHHFHPKSSKLGIESPMNGDPQHDITLLCELIQKGIYY
jgi:hypothetical protein